MLDYGSPFGWPVVDNQTDAELRETSPKVGGSIATRFDSLTLQAVTVRSERYTNDVFSPGEAPPHKAGGSPKGFSGTEIFFVFLLLGRVRSDQQDWLGGHLDEELARSLATRLSSRERTQELAISPKWRGKPPPNRKAKKARLTNVLLGLPDPLGREVILLVHRQAERSGLDQLKEFLGVGLELFLRVHVLVQYGSADCCTPPYVVSRHEKSRSEKARAHP